MQAARNANANGSNVTGQGPIAQVDPATYGLRSQKPHLWFCNFI